MRPGKYDRKHQLLITGAELRELKELDLAESFGLDRRIERYEGKRPLGSAAPMERLSLGPPIFRETSQGTTNSRRLILHQLTSYNGLRSLRSPWHAPMNFVPCRHRS
jgi:hypothetical protein